MPRRGGSSPMLGRRPAPAPVPRRPMTTAPAHPPPAAAAPATAPRQPGLFGQIAATATGVAIGSAVGHTIGASMTGSGGGYQQPQEVAPAGAEQPPLQEQQVYNPCQHELKQFLDCAQNQSDISICAGFNEALRQCKLQYGIRP